MKFYFLFVLLALSLLLFGCATKPYDTTAESADPWLLIYNARDSLEQGRPRAALPSLGKALSLADQLDPALPATKHVRAATLNEIGRVFEMTSDLKAAEQKFQQAAETAAGVPDYRPLHFDIRYNLSTVYERQGALVESCKLLKQANALLQDLLAHPDAPPKGYGNNSERFLRERVMPRVQAKSVRIGCALN